LTTRRDARRTAIDILYQADVTGEAPDLVLTGWDEAGRDIPTFTHELVDGVAEHQPEIDLLLEEHAEGWTVARMTALDRTIMRVGVEELLHRPDVPASAAISEAVEATAELSADESRRFVNGVLGRIARELAKEPTKAPTKERTGPQRPAGA
jgi:transcription antitermination factor NusB